MGEVDVAVLEGLAVLRQLLEAKDDGGLGGAGPGLGGDHGGAGLLVLAVGNAADWGTLNGDLMAGLEEGWERGVRKRETRLLRDD